MISNVSKSFDNLNERSSPSPMGAIDSLVLLDPLSCGHHVHRLRFMLAQLARSPFLEVIPVGNKRFNPGYEGIEWAQAVSNHLPVSMFLRFVWLSVRLLWPKKGRRALLNLAYDNSWYYFGMFFPLLAVVLRIVSIRLLCLQYRADYVKQIDSATELLKYLVFFAYRRCLGEDFTLIVTHPEHADPARGVVYLADLGDLPQKLPSRQEARDFLRIPLEDKVLLFFGNINDERKGFIHAMANLNRIPAQWSILAVRPRDGHYLRAIEEHSARFHLIEGSVDDYTKRMMFRAADGVLALYDESFRGSSGVITDAVMYEVPIISTRFKYAVDLMSRDSIGVFVAPASQNSWERAVEAIERVPWQPAVVGCKKRLIEEFEQGVGSLLARIAA